MRNAVIAVAVSVACFCGTSVAQSQPLPEEAIEVAVPSPLGDVRNSIALAVHTATGIVAAEINAAGGIRGRPIRLRLYDDPCSTEPSGLLIRDIASGTAAVVIGHGCPASHRIAAGAYASAGKMFISTGSKGASGPGALQLPSSRTLGAALAAEAATVAAGRSGKRIAVVRDKTQLNVGLARQVEAALRAASVPVISDVFNGGDKDFAALTRRLVAADVSAVVLLAFAIEGALFSADMVRAAPDITILGPDHLAGPDFGRLAGLPAAARVRVLLRTNLESYVRAWPAAGALAARLAAVGIAPRHEAIEAAAALQAWASAGLRATSLASTNIAEQLKQPQATIIGPLAFDAQGNANQALWRLHSWRDGGFQMEP